MQLEMCLLNLISIQARQHRYEQDKYAAEYAPLGDTNRTFVVYKQKPTDFQCDHLLTVTQTNTKLRVARQRHG